GDDHVAPDDVEDVAARNRLVPAPYEQDQQVEVAGDEGHLAPGADEHAAARRERELREAVARAAGPSGGRRPNGPRSLGRRAGPAPWRARFPRRRRARGGWSRGAPRPWRDRPGR